MSLLALILAKARQIEQVNIAQQQGRRKIDVKVDEEREWEDEYGGTYKGGIISGNSAEIVIYERGQ